MTDRNLRSRDLRENGPTPEQREIERLRAALQVCEHMVHRAAPADEEIHAAQRASGAYCTDWDPSEVYDDLPGFRYQADPQPPPVAAHCPDFPDCREERQVRDLLASVKAEEPVGRWVSGCAACEALADRAVS